MSKSHSRNKHALALGYMLARKQVLAMSVLDDQIVNSFFWSIFPN